MTDMRFRSGPSVTALAVDALGDVHKLIRQQVEMFASECRADWQRSKEAAGAIAIGAVPLLVGCTLLGFMFVHLLYWLASPVASQPGAIPLWCCYAIVGAICSAVGAALLARGMKTFRSFNPLPDESIRALEENLQWLTNRK